MATTNKAFRVKSGLVVEGGVLYPATGTTSIAPLVFTSGTNLTSATAGAMEYDGTNFYLTPSSTRKTIAFLDSNITGSAGSVGSSFVIKADSGTTEGTDLYTFNGSAAKTLNLVAGSNITITKSAGSWTIASAGSGSGTVTSVSVVSANGFAGTVATSTSTPAITLSTTITGLLKGNGTAISAASAGTDYVIPSGSITGSAGSVANALTIGTGLSGTASTYNGSAAVTVSLPNTGTAGTYTKVTTDAQGRVSSGTTLSSSDIPTLGNITNAGAIGSTSGLVVSTTTSGVLTASSALPNGTTATTQSAGDATTKVATTAYVDTAVANGQAGFNVHASVLAASTTNISGTYTNGTADQSQGLGIGATFVFTAAQIDGVTLAATNRVLLKNQTDQKQNGVYVVTTVSTNITLTRASDFDNSFAGEVYNGDLIYIGGTGTQAGTTWVMNANGTATTPAGAIKIGTDNITWAQFAGAGTYTGSNGVSVSGTSISGVNATTSSVGVASFPSTQFSVTTGAVTIASLAGSVINSGTVSPTYGGTGVNNGSNTLTLAGNVSHAGSFTQTFTATGNTSVTLPTSGTLATLAGSEALTGKTYNGLTISTTTGTLTVTNAKTLSVSNTLTLAGTDGSTLNIGSGGTLGSNAFTSTAYAPLASPALTGTVTLNSIAGRVTASGSTTGTTALTLSSVYSVSTYNGGEFIVKATNGSNIEITKILVVTDGSNVYVTNYGDVYISSSLVTVDFSYTSTNVNMVVTPVAGTTGTTTVKVSGTLIAV